MTGNTAVRSEFLFCYDARMANPNGDPDENRPRIDPLNGHNLVTDFRLKRTVRDYLWKNMDERIFIRAEHGPDGKLKQVEDLAQPYIDNKRVNRQKLLGDHIDIRLFGILFPVGGDTFKQVGPIQFGIGESLNPVEEIPIRMTRVVPTKAGAEAGTFGEKSVVRYSFIVFHGFLNDLVAKESGLREEDVEKMMKAMWFGTTNLSTTSKYGQTSRLLLRIKYSKPLAYIGDLDRQLSLFPKYGLDLKKLEDLSQVSLDVERLASNLERSRTVIDSIDLATSPQLECVRKDRTGGFQSLSTSLQFRDLLGTWSG
jgi:CRISPR-associated protein Csh2